MGFRDLRRSSADGRRVGCVVVSMIVSTLSPRSLLVVRKGEIENTRMKNASFCVHELVM